MEKSAVLKNAASSAGPSLATYTLASHVPNTRLMVRTSQFSFLKGDTANLIDLVNGPGYRPGGTAS